MAMLGVLLDKIVSQFLLYADRKWDDMHARKAMAEDAGRKETEAGRAGGESSSR